LKGYEITDRGKIIVAVVLVVVILTTAVFLAVRALNGSLYPPEEPPQVVDPGPGDDEISGDPINGDDPTDDPNGDPTDDPNDNPTGDPVDDPGRDPNGNTVDDPSDDPTDDPNDDPNEDPTGDPSGDPTEIPPEVGPVSINRSEGTMSFMFAPSVQSTLDNNSILMLKEFIDSPMNTSGSQLTVEMPHLSESDVTTLIRAITGAFSEYGIAQRDITFLVYRPESTSDSSAYEIKLSFRQPTTDSRTTAAPGRK